MKKSKEKPTYEELEKQLNKALSEAKHDKAELKKANKKIDDLELKINLLEYLNDPENSQKKSKLTPQWKKIADVFLAIHTEPKT